MLWKPAAPVYPKLIQEAPEGLTKAEADEFRKQGEKLLPICKLGKFTRTITCSLVIKFVLYLIRIVFFICSL